MVIRELTSAVSPPHTLTAPHHNLPIQLTSFIGRERELAQVKRLLSASRLVTLSGPGGCGKTRLAIKVAGDAHDSFADGVWWVELAALADETLVPQAIARTLEVREAPNEPLLETLANFLRAKALLLVIDNCEHLITACAQLVEYWLRASPTLNILATSREPLAIGGETVYQVPTLSLPVSDADAPTQLLHSEAVRLFIERAQAVSPNFVLSEQNARTIAQICQRLDGIPLAIELAAARVKLLTVQHLAKRLDDRFNLLTTGSRTALPRQQTLRATIDWSYDLLTEPERVLLRRLAVFAGGCTLEAAEQVCADQVGTDGLLSSQILDLLSHLVDKSLVIVDKQGDETRYRMLETIRQYASEKLSSEANESGESAHVRDRHLDFFFKLIEEAEPKLRGAEEMVWLERLDQEHDNLRTALEWAMLKDNPDVSLEFVSHLRWFLWVRGYLREGSEFIVRAMEKSQRASIPALAAARVTFGIFMVAFGEYERAETSFQEGFMLYEGLGDEVGVGAARHYLAVSAGWQGDRVRLTALLEENLALWRKLGDKWWIAQTLDNLGGNSRGLPDPKKTAANLDEALTLWKEIGNKRGLARSTERLAQVMEALGNYGRAMQLNSEALSTLLELRDQWSFAQCLITGASVAGALRHFEAAARFLGAAAALREAMGFELPSTDQIEHERIIARVRPALDDATFLAAWNQGRTMTMQQVVECARAIELAPMTTSAQVSPSRQAAKDKFGGLTEREREVAAHIAQGQSNREIAEALVVSERTVETHVTNILNKLGFTNRAEIRKWAVEKGLVKRVE